MPCLLRPHVYLFLTLWLVSVVVAAASTGSLDSPQRLEAFIDGLIEPRMKEEHLASVSVSIVHRGELILSKAYGYSDIEQQKPADPERTLFRPGSISKLFTWIAVMQLVEQGKLDLDRDVNQYLKSFQIRDRFPSDPITLRHLMTHTPGFEDGGLGYLQPTEVDRILPLSEAMQKYQPQRILPPGRQVSYSNYGTALAGLIVANVSGLNYQEYVRRHIFEPLNMQRSTFIEPLPAHLIDDMAIAYAYEGGDFVPHPFEIISNFAPAGAMSATADDLARFMMAMLRYGKFGERRILQEVTAKTLLERAFSTDSRLPGMALGFYESIVNGYRLVGHGGDTDFFHSDLALDFQNQLGIFISVSGRTGGDLRSAFIPALYDHLFASKRESSSTERNFGNRVSDYSGEFKFWRANFSTLEKLFSLSAGIKVMPGENSSLVMEQGGEVFQYVEIGADHFQEINSENQVAFQRDDSGEVTGLIFSWGPFLSAYKAPFYETSALNQWLLGLAALVFISATLRRLYQKPEPWMVGSAVWVSVAHLAVLLVGALSFGLTAEVLGERVPWQVKVWLILPILATLLTAYLSYQAVVVWKTQIGTLFYRIRLSVVVVMSLAMVWFYWFWNMLGFQYL
ncbi:beta-lactamase family protein [Pseudomaricurvus alkylphenolicus]|uniref:serine hydrolase domain-containing protein n=1 Tax=Pseudomaricurvus alkylphenolicus TaxID=1306991 RepID=UPI001420EAF4|nr:serine hydrolase domain-containing protein [Pseudomaricurvus alkylphenolicus]NIB38068.1 beta-lactamase family protein [Pseudomaricurvus alkylphenolicus]